jgi:hypothetical protein
MIRTEEDDEFERIAHEIEMKKGQPYHFKKRMDDDDIQEYVRPWVGLTDEEIDKCFEFIIEEDAQAIKFARAIEAKLKEKNNG